MRVNGIKTKDMDVVMSIFRTEIHIMAHMNKAKLMEKVYTSGKMEKYMTESGSMESRMDMEYGRDQTESLTLASG